jgi:DNA-binding response OmpR family regulator
MKPRVLIVDDDPAIAQQLFWSLCEDYDVVTANDMQSAVRRATIYQPDIAVLDLELAPDDGFAKTGVRLLKYLKSHVPGTKVLVMAGVTSGETLEMCVAGVDQWLTFPLDLELFRKVINRLAPRHLEVV